MGEVKETTTLSMEPELGEQFTLEGSRVGGVLEDVLALVIPDAGVFEVDRAALRLALDILERTDQA